MCADQRQARRMTDGDRQQSPSAHRADAETSDRPHVLLIEDDDVMREMLTEALQREGFRVTERSDAFAWLESCVRRASGAGASEEGPVDSYDVVVSDIRMPHMSGLDVLRILREINCTGSCPPTIFITAFGDSETHDMAHELGAAAVLDKPFPIKYLIEKVRSVASG